MNDFTKEELEIIRSWAVAEITQVGLLNFIGTSQRDLQRKVIAMIDNYCEHNKGVYYEAANPKQFCSKCRRVIE